MTDFLHFQPKGGGFGDPIPLWENGIWHIYYNKLYCGKGVTWGHISTKDFVHYVEHPDPFIPNMKNHPVNTGCVFYDKKGGVFHAYYADINDEYDLSNDPEYESPAAKYLQPGDSDLIRKALEIIITEQKASTSYLQRRLGIGYNKSAELMDELEKRGIISAPLPGGQKREILITDGLEEKE